MSQKEKTGSTIKYKLLYTALILLLYLLGREIPLYGIDTSAYIDKTINAEELLMQTIGGDAYRYSLFALGISPYMIYSIFMSIYVAYKKASTKERISPKKLSVLTIAATFILAVLQALIHVRELEFRTTGNLLVVSQIMTVIQMVTGVMIIIWLAERNIKYGIGGQTALIYVNIIDSILSTMKEHSWEQLALPLLVSFVVLIVVVAMETGELQIGVQRISIHNIYADKNYLAIKLNPIGIMPVMFSTAFFMLPQLLIVLLAYLFPGQSEILWLQDNMVLTKPLGIGVYIGIIYLLTIGFSFIFINPGDLTEQFLKSGDSLVNVHSGRDTKRYLSGKLWKISLLSATIMGICVGVPLTLQYMGDLDSTLVMLPSSVMMMTGMWCNLYQEVRAVKSFDAYQMFI